MNRTFNSIKLALSFSILVLASFVFAAPSPLKLAESFDLTDGADGRTFFEVMQQDIKPALDVDYQSEDSDGKVTLNKFRIVDAETFFEKADNFAHMDEIEGKVKGGKKGLEAVMNKIGGKEVTFETFWRTVAGGLNGLTTDRRLAGGLTAVLEVMSERGVMVRLDDENYVYNVGYAKGSGGSDLKADKTFRKTGRSFGASILRGAYDPSDNDYLRMLATYVANANDGELRRFYSTLFEILIKSDTANLKNLSDEGQLVMADFMAIYMAELDRHLMTGLKAYEWENALTEITMLAVYSVNDNGITLDISGGVQNTAGRDLIQSNKITDTKKRLLGYFGVGTDGSGLDGKNKMRRHNVTRHVSAHMVDIEGDGVEFLKGFLVKADRLINDPRRVWLEKEIAKAKKKITDKKKLKTAINKLTDKADIRPISSKDIYDGVMEALNAFESQRLVSENADELIQALVEFIMDTGSHAEDVTAALF